MEEEDDHPVANDAGLSEDQENDTFLDDTGDFIDMNDAIEVKVDDDDVPMDDDDDDEDVVDETITAADNDNNMNDAPVVPDMSKFQATSHTDAVYSVAAFLENGKLSFLSGGGDDKAFFHTISTASDAAVSTQPLPYPHTDTVSSVAFNLPYVSDDPQKTPRLAAVGSYDGTILIYDVDNQTQKLKLEGPSDVEWLSFHPKGGTVLLAGSGDGTVWMFHVPLNRCLQVFVGHEGAVSAGAFSPDGKWALSASADGTLRIWAPKTGLNKHVFRFGDAGLTCLATHGGSDGMLVMVGGEDGKSHVCHIGTKKVVATLTHFDTPVNPPVMTSGDNENDDDEPEEMEFPMSVEAVGFSPSQPYWCATGGVDGKLKIWDLSRDGQCRQVCVPENSGTSAPDSITRLQWHPSLPLVFAASISGAVRLWDARTGTLLATLTGGAEQINDLDIQFVPNSGIAILVTGSDDKTVRIFEVDVNALL
ncbi:WD40 repeat-containing protein [Nitzschia inconspicua]|uniref:WD40 repeat-containing protein n=1 Tax=Nitzschia inconspicua TaxID=303405 RepID=A0A9K3KDK7_9STRA|nr:WD40 repeat-containing protein [Nitzschia inconspicua]